MDELRYIVCALRGLPSPDSWVCARRIPAQSVTGPALERPYERLIIIIITPTWTM